MAISLSGLDLSFLRKNDPNGVRPGRTRIATRSQAHLFADKRSALASPYFMPDVDAAYGGAWKSIIDGSEISSRSNWREHDKKHDVINVGCNFWVEDGDDVRYTEEKMGYDPSLIGDETFTWKTPENL
jgi:hypothetical protein